jgi:hypothetical protein
MQPSKQPEQPIAEINRRRQAISHFQEDPEQAIRQFPDLEADLIEFFASSSNPYINPETNDLVRRRENDFALWERAQKWALAKLRPQKSQQHPQ